MRLQTKAGRVLEALQAEAIELANRIRAQRNLVNVYDFEAGNNEMTAFRGQSARNRSRANPDIADSYSSSARD